MLVESPNKTIKKGLIETFQRKDAKLYEALSKVNSDLDKVYETLFGGPLPAVDGSALLHINPANIDSPGDIPKLVEQQGQVAFLNVANVFVQDQTIRKALPIEILDDNTNAEKARFQCHVPNGAYFGVNLNWNGAAWQGDSGALGAGYSAFAGGLFFLHWTGAAMLVRGFIDAAGIWNIGNPLSLVNAVQGDIVLQKLKDIRASNNAATAALSMIRLDANDLIGLGSDALNTGKGHVAIPQVTAANLPAAAATADGIIVQDKTNNRFCFYQHGARYFVAGTAF